MTPRLTPHQYSPDLRYRPDLWYPSQLPPDIEKFVVSHGCAQTGQPVPPEWRSRRLQTPGRCYEAAGNNAFGSGCTYTEGRALGPGGWVPHAWITDPEGGVIDLAWDDTADEYFGVVIPDDVVGRAQNKLGLYGPLLPVLVHELGWMPKAP